MPEMLWAWRLQLLPGNWKRVACRTSHPIGHPVGYRLMWSLKSTSTAAVLTWLFSLKKRGTICAGCSSIIKRQLLIPTAFGAITVKQANAILVAIVFFSTACLYADYTVENRGSWPSDWPKELESLRKQSRTLEGPLHPSLHYAIPFTKRDEFEAAWPNILKVKTKRAPIVLRRGPSFWFENKKHSGVCVHTPPEGQARISDKKDAKGNWEDTIYIELIVDGEIVDLNRILLPPDTPIIDERFKND